MDAVDALGCVLLVEDNVDHAFLVRRQLAEHEVARRPVEHVATAAEAVARLQEPGVACVLLDLTLPDAREMDALLALRAVDPYVPIVVLTGIDSTAIGLRAVQAGANDYLVKGQHGADALRRSVMFAIERSRREAAERTQSVLGTQLALREAQLSEAQRLAKVGSWEWDVTTGQVDWSNELVRLSGLPELTGLASFAAYLERVDDEDRAATARLFHLHEARNVPVVVRHRLAVDGESAARWVLGQMRAAAWDHTGRPTRLLGTMQDITEQKTAEDLLEHQALHDSLTGLVNRGVLMDRLSRVLARPAPDGSRVAVVFLDLDQFKWVNDSHSHAAGDSLLVDVARRLEEAIRPSDTLARFGGDEFVVLCEQLADEDDVLALVDRLTQVLARPFVLRGAVGEADVRVTASMGVATASPAWGGSPDQADLLIRDADIAMYRAKERGRARFELFDEAMRARASDRLRLHSDLRKALGTDELVVYFQPIVEPGSATVTGTEALVRWQHPERGLLPPDSFIPQAEATGLIVELGRAVLDESCRVTADWNRGRATPLTVAVNLSARQLTDPGLLDAVRGALAQSGLAPELLHLEVTETVVMEDPEASRELLGQLRSLGVRIAIDDFGTGYSSLAYLLTLPLDVLKIDKSFVAATNDGVPGVAIVTAIVALASSLGLSVIAEGVETAQQRDVLMGLGVTRAQGWLWGKAVAPDRVGWLAPEGGSSAQVPPAVPCARAESDGLARLGSDQAGGRE